MCMASLQPKRKVARVEGKGDSGDNSDNGENGENLRDALQSYVRNKEALMVSQLVRMVLQMHEEEHVWPDPMRLSPLRTTGTGQRRNLHGQGTSCDRVVSAVGMRAAVHGLDPHFRRAAGSAEYSAQAAAWVGETKKAGAGK